METPQYLLKLTQRLPVAGHQLSLATVFWPDDTYNKRISKAPCQGACACTPFLVLWGEMAECQRRGSKGKRRRQSHHLG